MKRILLYYNNIILLIFGQVVKGEKIFNFVPQSIIFY